MEAAKFTDAALPGALKEGDTAAFEMIFRQYYQPLCNYACTYLRQGEEAEEVVQSAFLSMWEKRSQLAIHSGVKSYLYAMVRNACLNKLKHEKIKQKYAVEEIRGGERSSELVTRTIIGEELQLKIVQALEKLPEQCRLIFKMSRFEELKYAEIAQELNISVKTVENQMGKALKIMREQLKEYLVALIVLLSLCL